MTAAAVVRLPSQQLEAGYADSVAAAAAVRLPSPSKKPSMLMQVADTVRLCSPMPELVVAA